MGVGKTIQAISIAKIFEKEWPVLVITPSSLKHTWKHEILKWLKDIKENEIHILNNSKEQIFANAKFYILSYELAV